MDAGDKIIVAKLLYARTSKYRTKSGGGKSGSQQGENENISQEHPFEKSETTNPKSPIQKSEI